MGEENRFILLFRSYAMHEIVQYNQKLDCERLKMHFVNFRATTKFSFKSIANKPRMEIK